MTGTERQGSADTQITRVKLDFEQRQRAVALEDVVNDDPYATAAELIHLRDNLAAMTKWLEEHQPDVFRRGIWDAKP